MFEDLFFLIFSIVATLGSLALAGWLAITGQSTTIDGLFLTFAALVLALVFLFILTLTIRSQQFNQARENHGLPSGKNTEPDLQAKSSPSEKKKTA